MTAHSNQPVNLELQHFRVMVLRAPIKEPVRTAFGVMTDRPLVLVGITDREGRCGWGEIWCNFPSCGAEHRARLFSSEVVPLLSGKTFGHPRECFDYLNGALHLLVNQTGEEGPVAQVIAGVDIALWDLYAQVQSLSLYHALSAEPGIALGGEPLAGSMPQVPVYASGLNPGEPEKKVAEKLQHGYTAFKLKVGFGEQTDVRNVQVLRELLGPDKFLMVDANQAWSEDSANRMVELLGEHKLHWIEEPLPVDAPKESWQQLGKLSPAALAGGENLRGEAEFETAIDSGVFKFIQPDIAKWGGVSGTLGVARTVVTTGLTYCPHWLGGAVGLRASSHLLAAVGGDGLLEVDANSNPLRDDLIELDQSGDSSDRTGWWQPQSAPGLGIKLRADTIEQYLVHDWESQ